MSRSQVLDQQRNSYPVRRLCRVLQVVPACYYAWRNQQATGPATPAPAAWEEALEKAFTRHQKR